MALDFRSWLMEQGVKDPYGGGLGSDPYSGLARWNKWYKDYVAYLDSENTKQKDTIWNGLTVGQYSGLEAQGMLSSAGISLNPDEQQYLNNMIAKGNVNDANAFTEHMRDTSLTSQADQLSSLGLSQGNVLGLGGAGSGSGQVANSSMSNNAQENALTRFQQQAETTRSILNLVGRVASAGIHGASYGLLRSAGNKLASATAHSAESTLKGALQSKDGIVSDSYWNSLLSQL